MSGVYKMSLALGPVEFYAKKDLNYCDLHHHHGGYFPKERIFPSGLPRNPTSLKAKTHEKLKVSFCTQNPALNLSSSKSTSEKLSNECPRLFNVVKDTSGKPMSSSEQKVRDAILKQSLMVNRKANSDVKPELILPETLQGLNEAYKRCGQVCAEFSKTYYLGTLLMTPEKRRAIWAISLWCRRTDDLVDGCTASIMTPMAIDRWEQRLEDLFEGHPYDMLDAALSDTVSKFPLDIQPFRDTLEGMRMDLSKSRYNNFDELYLYCYYVAGSVALMSVPVMGISPTSETSTQTIYKAAVALGIANQLTNVLRDVGIDARLGRIYLPQDELAQFGLSDKDIFNGRVTDKWRSFMKFQIGRARKFYEEAEVCVDELDKASRWPVWTSLILYRKILDVIEANDYDNFTKKATTRNINKLFLLPLAYARAIGHSQQIQS